MNQNTNIKSKNRSRALMLGGATLVVLIVGVGNTIRMLQSGPRNSRPASGNQTPSRQTASVTGGVPAPAPGLSTHFPGAIGAAPLPTGGTTGTTVLQSTGMDLYADDHLEPLTTHDPFTPVVPLSPSSTARDARTPARRSMDNAIVLPVSTSSAGLPAYPGQTMPNNLRPVSANMSGEQEGKPAEELSLGGVISGPSAVAVLHLGDRCYMLMAGDKLPNQMVLTHVTDTGIYLSASPDDHSAYKSWFLEIGKPLHSATPINSMTFNSTPVRPAH